MNLPTGTATVLFTEIEGSMRLWEERAEAMRALEELPGSCDNTDLRPEEDHTQ